MEIMVSIIIPIYNVAEYIKRCMDSILRQTYENIEIILIDDGSTDGSSELCDIYCSEQCKVKTIHQDNVGLTQARYRGIVEASSDLIMFVDADDYVDIDIVEVLKNEYQSDKADMIVSYPVFEKDGTSIKHISDIPDGLYIKNNLINKLIRSEMNNGINFPVTMCGKLFKRDLLLKSFTRVTERFSYGEDLITILYYLEEINTLSFVSKWGYHYVIRKGSMSNSFTPTYFNEIKKLYDYLRNSLSYNVDLYQQGLFFIRFMIEETMENLFPDINIGFIPFVPPYELIPKESRVIIYGAGKVGKSFCKCFLSSDYVKVVGICDRHSGGDIMGIKVFSPEKINNMVFDYVVIANADKKMAEEMKDNLVMNGVEKHRIIWKAPYNG